MSSVQRKTIGYKGIDPGPEPLPTEEKKKHLRKTLVNATDT